VAAVNAALAGIAPGEPVVLVAHSNAGVFMPVIQAGLDVPVGCSVFADATVPAEQPRLPIDYYAERVPVPGAWDDHRCGYPVFSDPYTAEAQEARLDGSCAARRAPASDRGSCGRRGGDQRPGWDRGAVADDRKTANLTAVTSSTGQSELA
jgi:hypothetical protein